MTVYQEKMSQNITVYVNRSNENISIPKRMTIGSSGYDIYADISNQITILPGDYASIGTGLKFDIPMGYEIQIRPRSGLALKYGVTVLNSPGTIDSDYRGEVKVLLINHGKSPFVVNNMDRIAQMVVCKVQDVVLKEADVLSNSVRDVNGFGSTGVMQNSVLQNSLLQNSLLQDSIIHDRMMRYAL
jgi:dUTP pyrophosphatase